MTQQFQSVRQGTGQSFYNPPKNVPSPPNPVVYPKPDSNTAGFGTVAPKSKSFITRSNIHDLPRTNNLSGYVKSTTEMPSPSTNFTSTTVTSPTSTFNNYPGFNPPFQGKTVNA
jgi:hypothetical protein